MIFDQGSRSIRHRHGRSEILAATFTMEELERMLGVAEKAAEQRQQQKQEPTVPAAALSSGEDNAVNVTAQVVDDGRAEVGGT
jgi:hypothetical protein